MGCDADSVRGLAGALAAPGATASELSDYLVIDSATITGVIDRLSKTGALERRPDPSDRRAHRLYLTASGEALIVELQAAMDRINEEVAKAFGDDAETLWRLLRRLASFQAETEREAHV